MNKISNIYKELTEEEIKKIILENFNVKLLNYNL